MEGAVFGWQAIDSLPIFVWGGAVKSYCTISNADTADMEMIPIMAAFIGYFICIWGRIVIVNWIKNIT